MLLGYISYGYYLLLAIPGLLLGFYAQIKLTSAYGKYSQVPTERGLTGAEAAREILDRAGLPEMPIEEVGGQLTDHYDPTKKALFLSSENYHGHSLAAVGVAAHEAGHALQHKAAYAPLHLRMALVPITSFATNAAYIIFLLSFFLHWLPRPLISVAVIIFAIIAVFQVVTLPVEFDASRRAKEQLVRLGLISNRENTGVSKVLSAAAMTYVAAMVSSLGTLLYYLMLSRDDRN